MTCYGDGLDTPGIKPAIRGICDRVCECPRPGVRIYSSPGVWRSGFGYAGLRVCGCPRPGVRARVCGGPGLGMRVDGCANVLVRVRGYVRAWVCGGPGLGMRMYGCEVPVSYRPFLCGMLMVVRQAAGAGARAAELACVHRCVGAHRCPWNRNMVSG
jgi:hypothetical protein